MQLNPYIYTNMNFNRYLSCHNSFLPLDLHSHLLSLAKTSEYRLERQSKDKHYSHVFYSTSNVIASPQEVYSAKFYVNKSDHLRQQVAAEFLPHAVDLLKKHDTSLRYFQEPQIHKLECGCYYRAHVDDYAGKWGYTYFLNEGWMWDFGGILRFYDEATYDSYSIFPHDNTLLLRDESKKLFHDVSVIGDHTANCQYLILGWASDRIPENPKYKYIQA